MLALIHPHAPGVFGGFRKQMMERRPDFFDRLEHDD